MHTGEGSAGPSSGLLGDGQPGCLQNINPALHDWQALWSNQDICRGSATAHVMNGHWYKRGRLLHHSESQQLVMMKMMTTKAVLLFLALVLAAVRADVNSAEVIPGPGAAGVTLLSHV